MNIVFFGTPQFAVPTLEHLIQHPDINVVAVVTQPDKRRGRGNELSPSPIKAIATAHQLPVWQPRSVKKDADTLNKLAESQADAFVVVAYGQILSQAILDMPRLGCINGHGSLLPHYRGAAPIQWCLYHGETETGITTMLMDAGMDTGAMLLKQSVEIGLLDNSLDLAKVLSQVTATLLSETLLKLRDGAVEPVPQNDAEATYAPLIQKQDYAIDWNRSAIALHNQVRGFFPNCFAGFRDSTLKISATLPLNADLSQLPAEVQAIASEWQSVTPATASAPGTVVALLKNRGPVVQTGDGVLLLSEVQMAGKRSQSGWDFANGTRLEVGDVLQNGST